jgi:hypothetical protein
VAFLNGAEAMREVLPERRRMVVTGTVDHRDDGPWAVVYGRGLLHDEVRRARHGVSDQSLDR